MKRYALLICSALLLSIGAWGLGQGLYIKAKAELAQILLASAWQETVNGNKVVKPWPWADTWPVAKIEVPRLQESAIVLQSASGQAMAFGPGHMSNTPKPGRKGVSVIAAHRDTHFRFLKDLQTGDVIKLTTAEGTHHTYRITQSLIRHAQNSGIDPHSGGENIALVTCYPFDSLSRGPLRYIVLGEKVSSEAASSI